PEVVVAVELALVLGGEGAAVVPDLGRVRIGLGLGRPDLGIDDQLGRNVAALGHVDAPEMADTELVLGVLAGADVDAVLVDDRRGDEVAARAFAQQLVLGVLGIAVELPQELAGGIEGVDPAIAAGKNDLGLAIDDGIGRVGPLAVLDQLAAIDQRLEEVLGDF